MSRYGKCPYCGIMDRDVPRIRCRNCGEMLLSDPLAAHEEAVRVMAAGGDVEAALAAIHAKYDLRIREPDETPPLP